ncbi:hypothetical protein ACFX2B_013888 [Malus domestica]
MRRLADAIGTYVSIPYVAAALAKVQQAAGGAYLVLEVNVAGWGYHWIVHSTLGLLTSTMDNQLKEAEQGFINVTRDYLGEWENNDTTNWNGAGWLQEAVEARSCMAISILAVVVEAAVVCSVKGFTKLPGADVAGLWGSFMISCSWGPRLEVLSPIFFIFASDGLESPSKITWLPIAKFSYKNRTTRHAAMSSTCKDDATTSLPPVIAPRNSPE